MTASTLDCRDPKDNKFLDLVQQAGAKVLVSSDDDLLVLHPWRGAAVLTPWNFCRLWRFDNLTVVPGLLEVAMPPRTESVIRVRFQLLGGRVGSGSVRQGKVPATTPSISEPWTRSVSLVLKEVRSK